MQTADEIFGQLYITLAKFGEAQVRKMRKWFEIMDPEDKGILTNEDFESLLFKTGFFLKMQEFRQILREFEADNGNAINYRAFMERLVGELSPRRVQIVEKAWEKISNGNETVTEEFIKTTYNYDKHPKVESGTKTPVEVSEMLEEALSGISKDGIITKKNFFEAYRDISATIPYSEDYFIHMISQVFGVTEMDAKKIDNMAEEYFSTLIQVMIEKVQQKCRGEGPKRYLQQSFKMFAEGAEPYVSKNGFLRTVEIFGVVLNEEEADKFFLKYSKDGKRVCFDEFIDTIY